MSSGGQSTGAEVPQVPQLDPNIKKLADQQLQDAQNFQSGAPGLKKAQGNLAQDANSQALGDTNKSITKNSNSRGLLYSGLRQGALASAAGQSASDLSQKQAGINQSVDDQVNEMNQKALQSQIGVQNLTNQRNALAYNIAKQ